MNQPVTIRRPEPDETPLSPEERLIAIREGWHPVGACTPSGSRAHTFCGVAA